MMMMMMMIKRREDDDDWHCEETKRRDLLSSWHQCCGGKEVSGAALEIVPFIVQSLGVLVAPLTPPTTSTEQRATFLALKCHKSCRQQQNHYHHVDGQVYRLRS